MKKAYNNKSYPDLKSQLHRAKDKIAYLTTDIERLEEENSRLRENLSEASPMYPEHYHEEKHTAFQLGQTFPSNKITAKLVLIGVVVGISLSSAITLLITLLQ